MNGSSSLPAPAADHRPAKDLLAEALRALALPHAVHVETVGFGIERCDGLRAMDEQHPAKLLQEIRSTIRAAGAPLESLPASEPAPMLAR